MSGLTLKAKTPYICSNISCTKFSTEVLKWSRMARHFSKRLKE